MNIAYNDPYEPDVPIVYFDIQDEKKLNYIIRQCTKDTCKWCGNRQSHTECSNLIPDYYKKFDLLLKMDDHTAEWALFAKETIPEGALVTFYCGKIFMKVEMEEESEVVEKKNGMTLLAPPSIKDEL